MLGGAEVGRLVAAVAEGLAVTGADGAVEDGTEPRALRLQGGALTLFDPLQEVDHLVEDGAHEACK